MTKQITRKFDHEKGKLRDKASDPAYRERFQEEGNAFVRGGISAPNLLSFRGSTVAFNKMPLYAEDKQSLLRTLHRHWRFVIEGQVGTVAKLRKNPKVAEEAHERFERTRQSVLRADTLVGVAFHPKTKREFPVIPFKCFLQPVEPFPNPIFKEYLAFAPTIVQGRQAPPPVP